MSDSRHPHQVVGRRHFLRGLGASVAVPMLQSLPATSLLAAGSNVANAAVTATGAPLRSTFVFFPNGAILRNWWPNKTGTDFDFSQSLKPLEVVRDKIQIMAGLDNVPAIGGPDGPIRTSGKKCAAFRIVSE